MQRKFGGFLHSLCETSLRLFHVPVPRPKQALRPFMVTEQPLLRPWAQLASIFLKALTLTGYFLASRYHPKSSRNLPKWNLSVVLKELTKALKTAFLLALVSSKCHSEIHAWVANKVSNLGQWEKVAVFPSSDFIANNQLAREGSQTVSPVTIPALTTIVDRQFKEDRTLCPVRALKYYLERTKDLRGSRFLLFSFKKGHTSDIRPAYLILFCYKQADQ